MKANELSCKDLMIGDYVYGCIETDIVGEATYRILCKVKEINEDIVLQCIEPLPDELDWQDGDDFSWIEPVPLTAEILSKCGFKKNKTGQWVIEKKHSIGCCGQTCSNTNPLEYAVWWDRFGLGCVSYLEKEGNMTLSGTTYVHQLQQVLRLFDLDKFIKIEL